MTAKSTDFERGDLTAEFISRRVIDCDGELVRRLLVERDGDQFAVLVAPEADLTAGLQTGEHYDFTDVLFCRTTTESTEERCPECGGTLRRGMALDAFPALRTAAERLDLGYVVVFSEDSTITGADRRDGVDDWTPMQQTDSTPTPPEYVCTDCGEPAHPHIHRETADAAPMQTVDSAMAAPADETVGLATGGAADATNFRENIRNGYTPQPEALATEGLFYDYYFETAGQTPESDALFAPRYAAATSEHPLTGQTERFLSVGLDSNLAVEEFERPPLDLVAVLDVSGSMSSQFDQYYYDEHGRRRESDAGDETKMEAAIESLCALTEQLEADDRLGVVLYNNRSHVAKPLRDVESTDMHAIRQHIREIQAGGGTNLADGFEAAWELLADVDADPTREQRVVFMTDMMPNTGATDEGELTSLFADAAAESIHTTFVGMGLDENAELADALSGIRGANHYFVTSGAEFRQRLGEEFAYMVTPLVYDLGLELEADGYEITAVHGSPTADAATGRLMHVGTLFPAPKQDGETRGGIVLVQLERTGDAETGDCELVASWTERDGKEHTQRVRVALPDGTDTYAHGGIRKAVALARYADTLRSWAHAVRGPADRSTGVDDWLLPDERGEHEKESVPLRVPDEWAERFDRLREYLAEEKAIVEDEELQQELDLLETLRAKDGREEVTD